MGVTTRAADAFRVLRKAKKAHTYFDLAKKALDEDTRSGALLKGGIRVSLDVAKKWLGSSLTLHPYYTYHKVHLEALSQALNASSMKTMAEDAFNRAVEAADSTSRVKIIIEGYTHRQNRLLFIWNWSLESLFEIQGRYIRNPSGVIKEIEEIGLTPVTLGTTIAANLYTWQTDWSELCLDAIELYLMVDAEARVAEEAMKRYDEKIKAMKSGGNIGRIAGYAAEQDRQWQLLDRMTNDSKSGKSAQAVEDPALHARRQRDAVDLATKRIAQACDIALSDAVNSPDTMLQKLSSALMK